MTIRQAVRSFLVPLTIAEVRAELDLSVAMGDTIRAGYVAEFLRELEADFNDCDVDDGSDVWPDARG